MAETKIWKLTKAFGLSLALTSLVSASLVVAKEKSPPLMAWMKKMTGQHWETHSVIAVILFVVLGLIFARANGSQGLKMTGARLIALLAAGVILGDLIIAGFYLIGD